jgi:hypothetical protein
MPCGAPEALRRAASPDYMLAMLEIAEAASPAG